MVRPRIPEGEEITDTDEITMEEYSENAKKRGRDYRELIQHLLQDIGVPLNARILQIGPGPDWIGIWLAQQRPDITIIGLEPSEDMIRVAQQNCVDEGIPKGQISYTNGVVENMTMFEDDSFDIVFSNDSLHHWVSPIDGFCEIARVVKPAGGVCISDDRRDLGITERFVVEVFGRVVVGKWLKYWKSSIDACYTADELEELLTSAKIKGWSVKPEFLGIKVEQSLKNEEL